MRVDAALADEPERRQAREQRRADLRALADEDQYFRIFQALCQCVDILDMVGPDLDVVARQFPEAFERTQGVEIVVENRDLH